jgi:protoporphyrinogen oxidase
MLVRNRLSRIYYNRTFFDYPLSLNLNTLKKLGIKKTFIFGLSYLLAQINPIKPESTLEDFLTNRFGRQLYFQFFKEYTEKVWGVPCADISADWGAQRIKSLSISKAILHSLLKAIGFKGAQSKQTSLIEHFLYPKYGPGQMWEIAASKFIAKGGVIHMESKVSSIDISGDKVNAITYQGKSGGYHTLDCDYLLSTMPIKDLVQASKSAWDDEINFLALKLQYRDFITVGLLFKRSSITKALKDNWIYIQEPGVNVGRIQIFNNWSPAMVSNADHVWLGLEFFCIETDPLWLMSEEDLIKLAQSEIFQIGLTNTIESLDAIAIKVPKAYPGYFGESFKQFQKLRNEFDKVQNLFLIGRNGMHRYNNQDHSMLTAAEAARQIISGEINKDAIWSINIDDEYHEESKSAPTNSYKD